MNIIFRQVVIFLLVIQVSNLAAQNSSDSLKHQFGLVDGLDTLGINTGDIVLFQSTTFDGTMTQIGTLSPFTHSAMVLKDQDGSLWITHATDNIYDGVGIPVKYEEQSRGGVILTRLKDSFLTITGGKKGFYKRIWIRKMDDTKMNRPTRDDILKLYISHKNKPFESSKWRFILSALDLNITGKDLLSKHDTEKVMCSEYIFILMQELSFPIETKEAPNEYTPKDISRLIKNYYHDALVFNFEDGMFRLK